MLTCIIQYQIDPTKRAAFAEYGTRWGQCMWRAASFGTDCEWLWDKITEPS
ncbi:hypothetical protein [uncultured Tateyamaria sp.]|uniref:hypothetical protein n=1 Tax=uncultured Tateyamaria sp. TaxID=455651 RepID=UPI002605F546|nr:hypothetical protein [uncultured Tateyamaria sp.]